MGVRSANVWEPNWLDLSIVDAATAANVFGLSAFHIAAAPLSPEEAARHKGGTATVCGVVAAGEHEANEQNQPTLLDLGKPLPNVLFTAVIYGHHLGGARLGVRGSAVLVVGA